MTHGMTQRKDRARLREGLGWFFAGAQEAAAAEEGGQLLAREECLHANVSSLVATAQ